MHISKCWNILKYLVNRIISRKSQYSFVILVESSETTRGTSFRPREDEDIVQYIRNKYIYKLLAIKFKQYLNFCSNSSNNYTPSSEMSPEEPGDPEEEDDVSEEVSANNKTIVVLPDHNKKKLYFLNKSNLKSKPVIVYNSLLKDKELILSNHKSNSGIYLLHNLINGKQYIGSAYDLRKRLATYYFPSRLTDNRYISNSLLKYGHDSFSLAILEILDKNNTHIKKYILSKEQFYINLYKPILNINPRAGSSLGFKHSE